MTNQLDLILAQHKNKTVILDTNILLVYLVGRVNPEQIEKFNRTNSRYCAEDFEVLDNLLSKFTKFATTPNILTEVSNLGGQLSGDVKVAFFNLLSIFIQETNEQYISSSEISKDMLFVKFGITDRGIFELVKTEKYLVITDDRKLAGNLENYSINFNNLRDLRAYGVL